MKHISLCIRVVLFALLLVQCVESNPGPSSQRGTRSASHRGRGRGRGDTYTGTGRGRGEQNGQCTGIFNDGRGDVAIRRSSRLQSSQSQSNSITSWLMSGRNERDGRSRDRGGSLSAQEHDCSLRNSNVENDSTEAVQRLRKRTDNDVSDGNGDSSKSSSFDQEHDTDTESALINTNQIMLEMHRMVKGLTRKFDGLKKSVGSLKKDNKELKEENKRLSRQMSELSATVTELENAARKSELKTDKLEAQSRCDNLRFFSIDEAVNESWEESEKKVRDYIQKDLELDIYQILVLIEPTDYPSKSKPRPLTAKFSFFKDKEKILRAYTQKQKQDQAKQGAEGGERDTDTNVEMHQIQKEIEIERSE